MFDFSWAELALIAAVALLVIGPKDLPRALRTAGMWARKARTISREFQSSIEQMVREAELDDVKKELQAATSLNLESEIKKTIDPDNSISGALTPPGTTPAATQAIAAPAEPSPETVAGSVPAEAAPAEIAATQAISPEAVPPEVASAEMTLPELAQRDIAQPHPHVVAPLPDPETPPLPEPQTHTDAEGHTAPAPSHSGGTP